MENKQEITNSIISKDIFELIPNELWLKIAEELEADDISALTSSSGFFSFKSKSTEFKKKWLTVKQDKDPVLCAQGNNQTLIYINKTLFVCGRNMNGQLGLGHQKTQKSFVACTLELKPGERVTQLEVGSCSSYLLTNHNRLLVCGHNAYGQLGQSDTLPKYSFTECAINLNPGESIKLMAAGYVHVLLLTNHNRLLVCGDNDWGQLGLGHYKSSATFTECNLTLCPEEKPIIIAAGSNNSMIATNKNRLLVCGYNRSGQLGLSDNKKPRGTFIPCSLPFSDESIVEIAAGASHTLLLTGQNRFFVCGSNYYGQLGLSDIDFACKFSFVECKPTLGQREHIITTSTNHFSCASYLISNKNRLFACGDNGKNALSLQNIEYQYTFVVSEPDLQNQESIKFVVGGDECTLIVTNQKRIYVCGSNNYGKLGLGDKISQPTFVALAHNRQDNTLAEQIDTASETKTILGQSWEM